METDDLSEKDDDEEDKDDGDAEQAGGFEEEINSQALRTPARS
jgi:hypothetical protein